MIEAEKAKKLNELMHTLKSSGLAASTKDAAELAEKILSGEALEGALRFGTEKFAVEELKKEVEAKEKKEGTMFEKKFKEAETDKVEEPFASPEKEELKETAEEKEGIKKTTTDNAPKEIATEHVEEFAAPQETTQEAAKEEKAEKQMELGDVEEKLPRVDEIDEAPELNRDSPSYEIIKETKTLKELMDEDAERIYKEEKKEENA
jgi:hypothetical protein